VDNTESPELEQPLLNNIMREGLPLFIVINKIDKMNQEEVVALMNRWKQVVREDQIIPVSATKGFNLQSIIQAAKDNLPENPPYFDKEMYTDRSERFLASEVIREKIYNRTRQEIPYSTEVIVTSFKEEETIIRIAAEIFVNRESQKPILIGRGGELMKKIGTDARKELEEVYGKKVFLELYVKVKEDWRENPNMLRQFGYES
jgi:GTPase